MMPAKFVKRKKSATSRMIDIQYLNFVSQVVEQPRDIALEDHQLHHYLTPA